MAGGEGKLRLERPALFAGIVVSIVIAVAILVANVEASGEIDTLRDVTIIGADIQDRSGIGVASGDVNDDGVDDLIVGVHTGDPGGR